jgi:hypothetical protein
MGKTGWPVWKAVAEARSSDRQVGNLDFLGSRFSTRPAYRRLIPHPASPRAYASGKWPGCILLFALRPFQTIEDPQILKQRCEGSPIYEAMQPARSSCSICLRPSGLFSRPSATSQRYVPEPGSRARFSSQVPETRD